MSKFFNEPDVFSADELGKDTTFRVFVTRDFKIRSTRKDEFAWMSDMPWEDADEVFKEAPIEDYKFDLYQDALNFFSAMSQKINARPSLDLGWNSVFLITEDNMLIASVIHRVQDPEAFVPEVVSPEMVSHVKDLKESGLHGDSLFSQSDLFILAAYLEKSDHLGDMDKMAVDLEGLDGIIEIKSVSRVPRNV